MHSRSPRYGGLLAVVVLAVAPTGLAGCSGELPDTAAKGGVSAGLTAPSGVPTSPPRRGLVRGYGARPPAIPAAADGVLRSYDPVRRLAVVTDWSGRDHRFSSRTRPDLFVTLPRKSGTSRETSGKRGGFASDTETRLRVGSYVGTGTVRWFDADRGVGFISASGNGDDLFFLAASVLDERLMRAGQAVEFTAVHGPKVLEATDVRPG